MTCRLVTWHRFEDGTWKVERTCGEVYGVSDFDLARHRGANPPCCNRQTTKRSGT